MAAMDKQIVVSDFVDSYLKTRKDDDNHPTIDSVIRELIHDSEAYNMMKPKKKQRKNHESITPP